MTTRETLELLRQYESRNVTFIEPDGSWPLVWERARGVHVWDAEGRRFLDLTAAFGVAAAGHANPRVVSAGKRQMERLLHAMGDVHPHELKARLARELSRLTFERWLGPRVTGKSIFCNSGFEAVEAALKTAALATARPGVLAFTGAYHGLGYGALNATERAHFSAPFRRQLGRFGHFVRFPLADDSLERDVLGKTESSIRALLRAEEIGAILVEPLQVRGGINVPPLGFLPLLRKLCDEHRILLILDEIYTGFGRTGKWFACEHAQTAPDVICLGKALTGGFPLSVCLGRAAVMDAAWPPSTGEALHTSTFLGHPVGCAMALAQIRELERGHLIARSAKAGAMLFELLRKKLKVSRLKVSVRGLGLALGIELREEDGSPATVEALEIIKRMLHRGFILLPEGEFSNVISFTPPLMISEPQLRRTVTHLGEVMRDLDPAVQANP